MLKHLKPATILLSLYFSLASTAIAQQNIEIQLLERPPIASIRGMSVVNDSVVWVSGTGGQAGVTTDGGEHWQWMKVPGHDSADWRSLYAFSAQRALLLNAGEPAYVMLTEDGGHSWKQIYFNNTKGIFFDDMAFSDAQNGWAIGDPINNRFMVIQTHDGGLHWDTTTGPPALEGEAIFAASGSNIAGKGFVTGGKKSRFINGTKTTVLPLIQGESSTGAFSVAFHGKKGVVVGGDYLHDTCRVKNCAYTHDNGRHWQLSPAPPAGYRSCVQHVSGDIFIATGTTGTDISNDGGIHWKKISDQGFHVAGVSPNGKRIWLAGSKKLGLIKKGY